MGCRAVADNISVISGAWTDLWDTLRPGPWGQFCDSNMALFQRRQSINAAPQSWAPVPFESFPAIFLGWPVHWWVCALKPKSEAQQETDISFHLRNKKCDFLQETQEDALIQLYGDRQGEYCHHCLHCTSFWVSGMLPTALVKWDWLCFKALAQVLPLVIIIIKGISVTLVQVLCNASCRPSHVRRYGKHKYN